jgi:large subunit ribosomal protein L10
MPNEKVLSEKQAIVAQLTEKLKSAGGVFVDYSGITVVEDTEMRRAMRNAGVEYTVVKNTLTRFAAKNVGFDALDPILNGTTALAVSADDPVAAAKLVSEYANKPNSKIKVKAGFVNGKVISPADGAHQRPRERSQREYPRAGRRASGDCRQEVRINHASRAHILKTTTTFFGGNEKWLAKRSTL